MSKMFLLKKIYYKFMHACNKVSFAIGGLFPIDNYLIVLESEGDFSDNAEALYTFIKNKGLLSKYKVVWLVDNPKSFINFKNTKFVNKKSGTIWFRAMYYLARTKFFFYDHNNLLEYERVKKRSGQCVVYLTHGTAFKDSKGEDSEVTKYFDKLVSLGEMSTNIMSHFWNCSTEKIVELGEPRQDYYYSDLAEDRRKLNSLYGISKYRKVILWMPTFRKSNNNRISEDYVINETGLPTVNTKTDLLALDEFLNKENLCLLLKVHHLQANLPIFENKFNNIHIIKDAELKKNDIKLYKFIALTDALITDYSSISIDYLPLNRPIIYTLDDYQEYKKSRGIYPDNALDYMPGAHVVNIAQLETALKNVAAGIDEYTEQREKVTDEFYAQKVGNASERILQYFGVENSN